MPHRFVRSSALLVFAPALALLTLACGPSGRQQPAAGEQPASGQPKAGGVLNTGDLRENLFKDPWRTTAVQDGTKILSVYNGLIQFDPMDGKTIIPDLADRWEVSPDGKEFTFYLHKGVKFHDGDAFDAEDVKATFARAMKPRPELGIARLFYWRNLASVDVVDSHTVKLVTSKPQPSFLSYLAVGWSAMMSKADLERNNGDLGDKMNGTGAFKFVDYTVGVSWTVEKNKDYFREGRPYLDGVKQFILPDDNARISALRTKQIELVFSFPGITVAQAETLKRANLPITIEPVVTLVGMDQVNINSKHKPYDDKRVRQAMSIAIDRPGSIKIARQGNGKLSSYFPPGSPWALPEEELLKFPGWNPDKAKDVDLAKKLLADAGYPNGFDGGTLLVRAGQTDEDEANYVQQEWEKIGIKLQQKKVDSTVFSQLTRQENFDTYPIAWGNLMDDPDDILSRNLHSLNTGSWFVKDKKLDEMLEKQSETIDPADRKKQALEIQRYAINDLVPLIDLHYPIRLAPYWNYVKNWTNPPSTYNHLKFQDVWLDK